MPTNTATATPAAVLNHIGLSPGAATITAGGSQSYTVTAYDWYNNELGDVTASSTLAIERGTCAGATCAAPGAGDHLVTATYSGKKATAMLHVDAAPFDHVVITPANATTFAGGTQAYTATAYDAVNNILGNVTTSTTFSIAPDGSCTGAACSAPLQGSHAVTGSYAGTTGMAGLQVNGPGTPPSAMFGRSIGSDGITVFFFVSGSSCAIGPCVYSWAFGDGATGTGVNHYHTYTAGGTYNVTLTVTDTASLLQGTQTAVVTVTPADRPPVVNSYYLHNANTWMLTLTDTSADDHGVKQVTVKWGDTSTVTSGLAGATFSHTYLNSGTYTVTHKAIDTIGQQATETFTVAAALFTISGTVLSSDGVTPVQSATVQIKSGTTLVKTGYTATDGTFSVAGLKPGTYSVVVSKPAYTFPVPAPTVTVGPNSSDTVIRAVTP